MQEIHLNAPPTTLALGSSRKAQAFFNSPNAYVILTAQNLTTGKKATDITVEYAWGGNKPESIKVGPEQNAPTIVIKNFEADKLTVTVTGDTADTTANIGVYGAGKAQHPLKANGQLVPMAQYSSLGCSTVSNYEQLVFQAPEEYSVVYLFSEGGLSPEPTAYCINAPKEGKVPKGYVTTSNNKETLEQNWEGNQLTMVNMSNDKTATVQVSMTNLG